MNVSRRGRVVAGVAGVAMLAAGGVGARAAYASAAHPVKPSYTITQCRHSQNPKDGTWTGTIAVQVSDPDEVGYDLTMHYGAYADEPAHASGSQPWTWHMQGLDESEVTDQCRVDFVAHPSHPSHLSHPSHDVRPGHGSGVSGHHRVEATPGSGQSLPVSGV